MCYIEKIVKLFQLKYCINKNNIYYNKKEEVKMKKKYIAIILSLLFSQSVFGEYKLLTKGFKFELKNAEEVISSPLKSYENHTTYLLSELSSADFDFPATGYTTNNKITINGEAFGSPYWGSRYPYNVFKDTLLTDSINLSLETETYTPNSGNAVLGFIFNEKKIIKSAVLKGVKVNGNIIYPRSYRYEASNDGVNWVSLSSDYSPPLSKKDDELAFYRFDNDTAYKYYQIRLMNGSTYSSSYHYISSLFFYE